MDTHGRTVFATLFELAGLYLRAVFSQLPTHLPSTLAGYALGRDQGSLVTISFAWFFTLPCLIRVGGRRPARHPGARRPLVSVWSGMQGMVSRAVALALPSTTTRGGDAFPQRTPHHVPHLSRHLRHLRRAGTGPARP